MKNINYELEMTAENYFQETIKKSWTWQRLTGAEQVKFIGLNFKAIKGTRKQRIEILNLAYNAFLVGLGYETIGWREPNENEQKEND